jgi:ligand-binding sensor domain-containing protein
MTASGARSDLPQAVIDLAQDDQAAIEGEASATGAAEVELALADLVSDANGEVVVFNDSGFRTMAIRTGAAVTAEGRVQKHITASGEDVAGFNYVTFDNGVTLYYPDGLDLMLQRDGTGPAR